MTVLGALLGSSAAPRLSAEPQVGGGDTPSLLLERFAGFEGVERSEFRFGNDLIDPARAGFFANNGVPTPQRVDLTFPASSAHSGVSGAHIVLKDPQGNLGYLGFRFPLKQPLLLQAGEERTLLLRFWVRGEHHLEDGAYTKVRFDLVSGDRNFVRRWNKDNPIQTEAVRMPGAPRYVIEESRFFPDWTLLGATYRVRAIADGAIWGAEVDVAKSTGVDLTRPMWLDLDDVSLLDITHATDATVGTLMRGMAESTSDERKTRLTEAAAGAAGGPDQTQNRLRNASFETDADYVWTQNAGSPINPSAYVAGGYDGQRALAFSKLRRVDGSVGDGIETPAIPVRPFRRMVFSVWVKQETPGQAAFLSVTTSDWAKRRFEGDEIGGEWRRLSFSFIVGERAFGGIGLFLTGRNVLIDAVQLQEGVTATPFEIAEEFSTALLNDGNGNIQLGDQPFSVVVQAAPGRRPGGTLTGTLTVTDVFGRSAVSLPVNLEVPSAGKVERRLQLPANLRGIFNVSLEIAGSGARCETVISRVPEPRRPASMDSIIGDTPYFNDFSLGVLEKLGVRWVRTIPSQVSAFTWAKLETAPGQWNWAFADQILDRLKGHDLAVLGLIWGAPEFASAPASRDSNHGGGVPADLGRWRAFTAECVRRYGNRVAAWEIWNEPSGAWYPPLQVEAYAGVKQADARAYAIGWTMPEDSHGSSRFGGVPSATASLDGFDVHLYGPPYARLPADLLKGVGNKAGQIQIWNSEVGSPQMASMYRATGRDDVDRRVKQAADMAQLVLLHKAVDAKFIYYTSRFPHGVTAMYGYSAGIFEPTGVPTSGGVARAIAAYMVDGSSTVGWFSAPAGDDLTAYAVVCRRDAQVVAGLFLTRNQQAQDLVLPQQKRDLVLPAELASAKAFDMMDQEFQIRDGQLSLAYTPVYLTWSGVPADQVVAGFKKSWDQMTAADPKNNA